MSVRSVAAALLVALFGTSAWSIDITVDYRYDTNNFFPAGSQQRVTLEAAAQRFSDIITTSLTAENLQNNSQDPRIGFTHPGNGLDWQVSPATSTSNDALFGVTNPPDAAEEYRGPWSIGANEWILYAGARSISAAGQGGTGTGLNFTNVFTDENSHINRGFRSVSEFGDLPVWGGAITFDTGRSWHFDLNTPAPTSDVDFYSIALHEIGHALGLSTSWDDWSDDQSGSSYFGSNAVAAYNDANGASLSSLNLVSAGNSHWQDGIYDAPIFAAGDPNLAGTVGLGSPQDLLMEPTANFSGSIRRFELTTVDVAALQDIGWSVIADLPPTLPGDYDLDGDVDAADYVFWQDRLGTPDATGTYFEWSTNYGRTSTTSVSVPEPTSAALAALLAALAVCNTRGERPA